MDGPLAASSKPLGSTVEIEFGEQKVNVPKGGYYDRYQMNPNLDEVAGDSDIRHDIDFFRTIPKRLVDSRVGRIYSPNFYYRTRSVQLVYLAPLEKLRTRLPVPLEPITVLPGYGLVALTTFYGYVLALPVNTEIARVRGVYGYQFPKWLAGINVDMDSHSINADVVATDGTPDLALRIPLPSLKTIQSQSALATNNAINKIDGKWCQVMVQTNPLLAGQTILPRNVTLMRSSGPLSKLLSDLGVSTIVRMDVLKEGQMILNMPTPLDALDNTEV